MNISNLERLDTPTSWAWDFNYNGSTVWMVSQKEQDSTWLENKRGELVGVAEWVTRIFIDGQELQSHYSTQKWASWDDRKYIVETALSVADFVRPIKTQPSVAVEKAKKKVATVKKSLSGLNEKEQLVLKELYYEAMSCSSGEFGFTDDVIKCNMELAMTKAQLKGYIGSIVKKDLVWIDYSEEANQFGFTDKGWKALFDLNIMSELKTNY